MFLEKDGNKVVSVQQVTSFSFKNCKISFPTPNSVSLFLSKSWKEYQAAASIYKSVFVEKIQGKDHYHVSNEDLPQIFDYLEHIQASIISIYSALEALCNVAIPNNYSHTKVNGKGVTEIWNKSNIERWITTEEKLRSIVPEILKIESPKKLPLWKRFESLKSIRDSIIHQKQSKKDPNNIESDFLSSLLDESIFNLVMAGFEIIQYFHNADQMHTYFPMLSAEIPVKVNFVERFDGTFEFKEA